MKHQKQDILETGLSRKKAGTLNEVYLNKNKRPVSKKEISIIGFTLVELIVVITILAILGTIAIMAFEGYSKNARDSARTSDISSMKKALELWILQSGTYPEPTNGINITYSGATTWTQGTYGATVHQTVGKLDKKPTDPLYDTDYAYSIATSKKEYQLGAVLEGTLASLPTIQQTYAATELKQAYVTGNYNGVVTSTQTGGLYYMLAVPSIILSDINDANLIGTKQFVLSKKSNLPHSYANKSLTMTGTEVNFTPVVVWSGTGYANLNNQTNFDTLVTNIQNAFTGTLFATLPEYTSITSTNQETSKTAVKGIIETSTKQLLTQVTTTETISINPYASCTAQNSPIPFSATSNYPGCNTPDIIVCSGSGTGYTISACNVGSSTGSTDWTVSRGKYFQWGRNKGFIYEDASQQPTTISGSIGLNASSDDKGFVWSGALSSPYSWANTDITNNWGDNGGTGTNEQRQGPCASGYHVPKQTEWSGIVTAGQWGSNGQNMQTALKLPYIGDRYWSDGSIYLGGSRGNYWSSSPFGPFGYFLRFNSTSINPSNYDYSAFGYSVRCFKN